MKGTCEGIWPFLGPSSLSRSTDVQRWLFRTCERQRSHLSQSFRHKKSSLSPHSISPKKQQIYPNK